MKIIEKITQKLSFWLQNSSHIHLRHENVNNLQDLVGLIDRFVDGHVRYGLEWDDFISWKHNNPYVEEVRCRIGLSEPPLFSKSKEDRKKYVEILINERNTVAAIIGVRSRNDNLEMPKRKEF